MLDHDEERRLAEIEDHLRLDDPELWDLFDQPIPDGAGEALAAADLGRAGGSPLRAPAHPLLASVTLIAVALAATTVTTLLFGPNLGGLVAVLTITAAGMYAYQVLRGCPGRRRAGAGGDRNQDGD